MKEVCLAKALDIPRLNNYVLTSKLKYLNRRKSLYLSIDFFKTLFTREQSNLTLTLIKSSI